MSLLKYFGGLSRKRQHETHGGQRETSSSESGNESEPEIEVLSESGGLSDNQVVDNVHHDDPTGRENESDESSSDEVQSTFRMSSRSGSSMSGSRASSGKKSKQASTFKSDWLIGRNWLRLGIPLFCV